MANAAGAQGAKATIYHNPKCATSRKVLALIRLHGVAPEIVDYQKTPLSRDQLVGAKWRVASCEARRRLISSGNGE